MIKFHQTDGEGREVLERLEALEVILDRLLAQTGLGRYWSESEVCARFGCSARTLRRARASGRLVGSRIGQQRFYTQEALDAWLRRRRMAPATRGRRRLLSRQTEVIHDAP